MSARDKTEASLYKAIDEFNRTACWQVLQYAQNRQYLAEHLANAMVPSWLHERKAETAGEEIAHVLLMVGLFPNDWLDAHRSEVLAENGQAHDGELAMLRELVRTLRAIVRPDDADVAEVRRLLWQHASDDATARAEAAPERANREARLAQLLDTIRTRPGHRWSVGQVQDLRRLAGGPAQRGTARHDLQELYRRGHLVQHGPQDGRFYTLKTRKGGNA